MKHKIENMEKKVKKTNEENKETPVKKPKTKNLIIEMMKENPSITMLQLSEQIGVTPKAIEKQIMRLRSVGLIKREGSNRSGVWRVIEK